MGAAARSARGLDPQRNMVTTMRCASRSGFTIIELLVVMVIIAVLTGMILAGMSVVRESLVKTRVRTALQLVRAALEARANNGALISPVVHPFANTDERVGTGRALFLRSGSNGFAAGAAVARTGSLAIEVGDPLWIAAAERSRVLLPDDVFDGVVTSGDAPHLTGLTRRELTVLGAAAGLVSHIRLPDPSKERWADRNGDGLLDTPYDFTAGAYLRSSWWRVEVGDLTTTTCEQAGSDFWSRILGTETSDDLAKLKFLVASPTTWPLGVGDRVRLLTAAVVDPDGALVTVAGVAVPYRLRGTALYDAWGTEILAWTDSDGRLILESAGRDGHFRTRLVNGVATPANADNIREPKP